MKLCGSEDCSCFVESISSHFHIRGSGGAASPLSLDWLLYPRGGVMRMSAAGTRYTMDSGVKIFNRLPILLRRTSQIESESINRAIWWTGINDPVDDTPPPPGELYTDPEFETILDPDAAAKGIIRFSSAYDNHEMWFEPLGVLTTEGATERQSPFVNSNFDARNLTIRQQNQAGFDTANQVRMHLHMHGANRSTIHASKRPCVRVPFGALTGNSWSFLYQIVNNAGAWPIGTWPRKIHIQVYGLWTAIPV